MSPLEFFAFESLLMRVILLSVPLLIIQGIVPGVGSGIFGRDPHIQIKDGKKKHVKGEVL